MTIWLNGKEIVGPVLFPELEALRARQMIVWETQTESYQATITVTSGHEFLLSKS